MEAADGVLQRKRAPAPSSFRLDSGLPDQRKARAVRIPEG